MKLIGLFLIIVYCAVISESLKDKGIEVYVNMQDFNELKIQFEELRITLKVLQNRLTIAEDEIIETKKKLDTCVIKSAAKVELKRIPSGCVLEDETIKQHGDKWTPLENSCTKCTCSFGKAECIQKVCPALSCIVQSQAIGECCPTCKGCLRNKIRYKHGDLFDLNECTKCSCKSGQTTCHYVEIKCPRLSCPKSDQEFATNKCCPVCKVNKCSKNNCHENATCRTNNQSYICICKHGFHGNGYSCNDINECTTKDRRIAHHCPMRNSHCVNKVGTYECICNSGYTRTVNNDNNQFCRDINECNSMPCGHKAKCINTIGSYKCLCKTGYRKQMIESEAICKPLCNNECQNGGKCMSPNMCQCKSGFTGKYCEIDIDECSLNKKVCPSSAKCVNTRGSFHCLCKAGFSISRHRRYKRITFNKICKDINECSISSSICDSDKICVNTIGGYKCICKKRNCSNKCNNTLILQKHWISNRDSCSICECKNREISCRKKQCLCSSDHTSISSTSSPSCCPMCRKNSYTHTKYRKRKRLSCKVSKRNSVELLDGTFYRLVTTLNTTNRNLVKIRNKQNCNICRCLNGNTYCSIERCPKLRCANTIREHGQCCRRCLHDHQEELQSNDNVNLNLIPESICDKQMEDASEHRRCRGAWGESHRHASIWSEYKCNRCHCNNGHTCCKEDIQCKLSKLNKRNRALS